MTPAVLTGQGEVLRRQVLVVDLGLDRINSPAFTPTASHDFLLSTLREHVAPEEAHRRYAGQAGLAESAGTWGISVGEASSEGLGCLDDALQDGNPRDHASIDFRELTKKDQARKGKRLAAAATARGCLHLGMTRDRAPRWALVPVTSNATPPAGS